MKKRKLGRTGLEVSELALGGVFVQSAVTPAEDVRAIVQCAADGGINLVDTAPAYGDSEAALGVALEGVSGMMISTKVGGPPETFDSKSRDVLMRSVENSLRLLKRDTLDFLLIHEPDDPAHDWWDDPEAFTGPITDVLAELKESGVILHTGIGGVSAYTLAHIVDTGAYDVVLTAFNYDLLYREATHEIFPAAARHDTGIILGSALHQGILAQRFDDKLDDARAMCKPRRDQFRALYELLDDTGMSLPELALRFLISNTQISTILVGPCNAAQMQQNIDCVAKGPLGGDLIEHIDEIAALVPFRPEGEGSFPFRK